MATHGWFELILLQFAAEIAEDFRALLGLRAAWENATVNQIHSAVAIIFVALVSAEASPVYPISQLTAASAAHSQMQQS